MELIGIPKGGRDTLVLAKLAAKEHWRIEGDFLIIYEMGSQPTRAIRIPSHVQTIETRADVIDINAKGIVDY